jgi:hypothetical protein
MFGITYRKCREGGIGHRGVTSAAESQEDTNVSKKSRKKEKRAENKGVTTTR